MMLIKKTLVRFVELGHMPCVLDSWARLALHVEPLRKQSKQEFTEKNKSPKWLSKTNVLSWDFKELYINTKCL
jgi:hypothetical protein